MAMGFARLSRLLVAPPLLLAFCLLSVFPHGHPVAAAQLGPASAESSHAPHPGPCLETGVAAGPHTPCAVCCFLRLLSGGQVATCSCSAPILSPVRVAPPPPAIVAFDRTGFADPRGPPAV